MDVDDDMRIMHQCTLFARLLALSDSDDVLPTDLRNLVLQKCQAWMRLLFRPDYDVPRKFIEQAEQMLCRNEEALKLSRVQEAKRTSFLRQCNLSSCAKEGLDNLQQCSRCKVARYVSNTTHPLPSNADFTSSVVWHISERT